VKLCHSFLSAEHKVLLRNVVNTSLKLFPFIHLFISRLTSFKLFPCLSIVNIYGSVFEFHCLLKNDARDGRRFALVQKLINRAKPHVLTELLIIACYRLEFRKRVRNIIFQ
jgi:hypothetical protein